MAKRILLALLALTTLNVGGWIISRAQGSELLNNHSFESYYDSNGGSVPTGWSLTSTVSVGSSGHKWPGESMTGSSWDVSATKNVFTMYGYQQVAGIRSGTKLRFSAWANVFTCDRATSCIEDGRNYRVSDQGSQARTRIGVDPRGGTDPNSANVQWSSWIAPFDQFQQMIIDFQSQNDNAITVFLNATQAVPMLLNHVYWDEASLQVIGPGVPGVPGSSSASGGGSSNNSQYAPTVKAQGAQPDGSIIHVVQPGDTLASIAYAYKITVAQLRQLNKLDEDAWMLQIGQKLIVKGPDKKLSATAAATGLATAATTAAGTAVGTGDGSGFGPLMLGTSTPVGGQPSNSLLPADTATPIVVGMASTPAETEVAMAGTAATAATAAAEVIISTVEAPATQAATATTEVTAVAQAPSPSPTTDSTTALPTVKPISTATVICVTAFEDANANHWQDNGEKLLAGVAIDLSQRGQNVKTVTTMADGPACFDNVTPGQYSLAAVPPGNYALTTAKQLEVEVRPGQPLALVFGLAKGYQPTADSGILAVKDVLPPSNNSASQNTMANVLDSVIGNSGLIVFGLAGLVLVTGLGTVLVMRRR